MTSIEAIERRCEALTDLPDLRNPALPLHHVHWFDDDEAGVPQLHG